MYSRANKKVPVDRSEEIEEEEEIMPARTTKRTRTGAAGTQRSVARKPTRKPFHKWKPEDYQIYREDNPYEEERSYTDNPHFFTKDQELVFKEIYVHKDYSVTLQHTIDINHLLKPKYKNYFEEALAMCQEFGLIPLMQFNQSYIEYYILQFYATVHFDEDEARTMRWMTKDRMLEATLKEFGEVLGYEDKGAFEPCGWRSHGNSLSSNKETIAHITLENGNPGKTAHLIPSFEILHRIFRETLMPRVGNWDEVHGYMFDLLKNSKAKQGTGEPMDVMDCIHEELWLTVIDKRAPIYGPFLMKLIRKKWFQATQEDIMKDGSPIVKHCVKELRVKKHVPPQEQAEASTEAPVSRVGTRATARPAGGSLVAEPSWFKKFQIKAKRAFCFKLDLEERMYEAHVYHKKAAARQKAMMRAMNMPVSPGSEGEITPPEEWKSKHGYWSDNDAPSSSTHHGQGGE